MLAQDHANALAGIVGDEGIRTGEFASSLDPGFSPDNLDGDILLLPRSGEQVRQIVTYCAEHHISIVPQGGLTGLSGGARSASGQVILQTTRMNQLIDIDFLGATACIEAGVTLQQLQEAVEPHGFSTGIDLAARGTATVGGMIATNAGGTEAFRNGTTRQRVLGLEAVLPSGEVFSDMKQVIKANEGLDIKQLFIGAEGTLGIITRVVLSLLPLEQHRVTAMFSCINALAAADAFRSLRSELGPSLLCAEIMWPDYCRTTASELELENLLEFAPSTDDLFVVIDVGCTDPSSGTEILEQHLSRLLETNAISSALIAQSNREAEDFWKIREESFLCDKVYPHGFWYDVSVPQVALDSYTEGLFKRVEAVDPGLKVFLFGHLGDGNLHLTISSGEPCPEMGDAINQAVYEGLDEIGGSFSAEHGIGTEKVSSLAAYVDPQKYRMMSAVKQLFDPDGIMNPGKVIAGP